MQIESEEEATEKIFASVIDQINLSFNDTNYPKIADIESIIIEKAINTGYVSVAKSYQAYRDKRAEVRRVLSIATNIGDRSTTDAA